MKASSGNYRRLARVYRVLEYVAFGRDLERARFTLLPALAAGQRILIIGEGDGRFLQRLLQLNPRARIDCIDLSPAMLARARARIGAGARRVRFQAGDIRTVELAPAHYDAVVTCFLLDCFSADDCAAIIARLRTALQSNARWLWSDFALPAAGFRRWRARVWLAGLYTFFRWATGLAVRELPPAEKLIAAQGFEPVVARTWQGGMLRSVIFQATCADSPRPGVLHCDDTMTKPRCSHQIE
ncbi:MAG: methyltransferase domain-containing protein [Opitutaceae bacterium]